MIDNQLFPYINFIYLTIACVMNIINVVIDAFVNSQPNEGVLKQALAFSPSFCLYLQSRLVG